MLCHVRRKAVTHICFDCRWRLSSQTCGNKKVTQSPSWPPWHPDTYLQTCKIVKESPLPTPCGNTVLFSPPKEEGFAHTPADKQTAPQAVKAHSHTLHSFEVRLQFILGIVAIPKTHQFDTSRVNLKNVSLQSNEEPSFKKQFEGFCSRTSHCVAESKSISWVLFIHLSMKSMWYMESFWLGKQWGVIHIECIFRSCVSNYLTNRRKCSCPLFGKWCIQTSGGALPQLHNSLSTRLKRTEKLSKVYLLGFNKLWKQHNNVSSAWKITHLTLRIAAKVQSSQWTRVSAVWVLL